MRLRSDPTLRFKSADEIVASSNAALARARAALPKYFGRLPKNDFIIEPFADHEAPTMPPAMYWPGPLDGSKPGIYKVNLYKPQESTRFDNEGIAFHEAIPGHHMQVALAIEVPMAHPIAQIVYSTAFVEGWGLYSERLADEMGLYSSATGRMGLLSSEAFRAARMVIDAGIHTKGWTRQQALDYLLAHTVVAPRTAEGEIDRYISWPGQAPSYMLGRLEILRLREQARQALGSRFDIRAFHDRVLENGPVPLWLLRANVERWIAASQAGKAAGGTTGASGTTGTPGTP